MQKRRKHLNLWTFVLFSYRNSDRLKTLKGIIENNVMLFILFVSKNVQTLEKYVFLFRVHFILLPVSNLWGNFDLMWPSDLQGGPCSAGWWLGSGLRGGRDAMWAKHDVFGTPLPPCHHLQPEHLSGFLDLTDLLPPRGECVAAVPPSSGFYY